MKRRAAFQRSRRGFLLMDLMAALLIATALITALSIETANLHRAQKRMTDARAAMRRVEQALLALQDGGAADPDLHMERLSGGLGGRVWVRVSLHPSTVGKGQSPARLVGLIPADKAPGGAP